MYLEHEDSVQDALDRAFEIKGGDALVNLIPEGPIIIPVWKEAYTL